MTHWNKTIDFYGCFHIDREHSRTENANVIFFPNQSDESNNNQLQNHKTITSQQSKATAPGQQSDAGSGRAE